MKDLKKKKLSEKEKYVVKEDYRIRLETMTPTDFEIFNQTKKGEQK